MNGNKTEAAALTPQTAFGKLTEREKRFAAEYLVDLNGTQAAIRAGYKPGRTTPRRPWRRRVF
ncbi:MAG: terminase small subunit [Oscillospiraceae bacterium]|nr:terminase small subunit [Oscillospiraceae bacterium]